MIAGMPQQPLVSVLIRTLGRATLGRSIESALAQTHRPLEIVVVNAVAKPLPPLPPARDSEIRIVEGGPYDRPRAANAALANATGDWLIFLDDDDTYTPTHVEWLLAAAQASGGARVAYSATACVEPDGKTSLVIGGPFHRLQLFTANYLSISAALFHKSLPAAGARFDESFACLEDWDFMIQLAQLTYFIYTGRPTNHWYAHAGESGAGLGPNKREDVTRPFRDRVVGKWAAAAGELREKVRRHESAAREAMARGETRDLDRHRAELVRLIKGAPGAEANAAPAR
jgi:glycosyltransferase involved in cell wall biosynthesis